MPREETDHPQEEHPLVLAPGKQQTDIAQRMQRQGQDNVFLASEIPQLLRKNKHIQKHNFRLSNYRQDLEMLLSTL